VSPGKPPADDPVAALALVPPPIADRTDAIEIG
jgi:hypothetical protein